jgi:hypothetical protein
MASTITFSYNGNSLSVNTPQYGYESIVSMRLRYAERQDGSIGVFDSGNTYDRRKCNNISFLLNNASSSSFSTFFKSALKGRGNDLNLNLGTNSGFCPFGPDLGDSGIFVVRCLEYDVGGQLHRPWKWFEPKITLQYISGPTPSYTVVDNNKDGNLQLGTVSYIRYPQDGYKVESNYSIVNIVTNNGSVNEIDLGPTADTYTTEINISASKLKMAAIVKYLVTTGRGNNFNIITQANNYPFGIDKSADGTFTVKLLNPDLKIKHSGYDKYYLNLKVQFIS